MRIATHVMAERGLQPEFSSRVAQQLHSFDGLKGAATADDSQTQPIADLTDLLWCSIDNDDSRDLDQLTTCEVLTQGKAHGAIKVLVAIADVDALVKRGSAIDDHAHANTTTVYTSARIFPMLPERLSCDLTSLNPGQDRLAIVTEMLFSPSADLVSASISCTRSCPSRPCTAAAASGSAALRSSQALTASYASCALLRTLAR